MLRSTLSLSFVLGSLLGPPAPGLRTAAAAVLAPAWPECPRGAAEPVVRKNVFPNTTFRLLPDKHTGFETVALPMGDQLLIYHEGCEYYVLRLRFETTRFRQLPTALEPWFQHAAQLVATTAPGLDAPLDIKAGLRALRAYTARHRPGTTPPLTLGEEISFGPEAMPSTVTVNRVKQLAGNKVAVEISFARGPL